MTKRKRTNNDVQDAKKSLKTPKGVIRIRISKYKRTNNDLQNIHIKLKIK
jgi:hypothetical protein